MKPERPNACEAESPDASDSEQPRPRFELGRIVSTPGALNALQEARQNPVDLLLRHVTGDWGELCEEDQAENELSVEKGFRILSSYRIDDETKIWIITEWDRSATTLLLPEEY